MTREEKFMPNGIPKNIRVYDYGSKSIDRYTVVYTGRYKGRDGCDYLGMSESPYHPQGVGQHGWSRQIIDRPSYKHLGKKIEFKDLPRDCQRAVLNDYVLLWRINNQQVMCKFCHNQCNAKTAHFHDGGWVGYECCWGERLRSTE